MGSLEHNSQITSVNRAENEDFNQRWISAHGLVGAGMIALSQLDVLPAQRADANPFMVVWLKNIERLCDMFNKVFLPQDFTLLDVGCGSGISTLFFAQNYSFPDFFGFDFSADLIDLAKQNREIMLNESARTSQVSFKVADAQTVRLPERRYALFMFNPFGWQTMEAFIENNVELLKKTGSVVLYANDIFVNELQEYGKVVARDELYNLSVISFR